MGCENPERKVVVDEKNFRPSAVYNLRGEPSKAKREPGWEATTRFKDLVRIMVEAELERVK